MPSIFSRIIEGQIPSYKIAENDDFYAFLDIRPISEGHTLVVPKIEIDYLFDLDDHTLSEMMTWSKKVVQAIDKALNPIRTGLIVQGLEVPHAHIHLVPLYKNNQEMSLARPKQVSEERMKEIATLIMGSFQE